MMVYVETALAGAFVAGVLVAAAGVLVATAGVGNAQLTELPSLSRDKKADGKGFPTTETKKKKLGPS